VGRGAWNRDHQRQRGLSAGDEQGAADRIAGAAAASRAAHAGGELDRLAARAAESLVFPLIVKPNVGGSGAGIIRFDNYFALVEAVYEKRIDAGLDGVLLLQEYHRPAGNSIVRVETLDGEYLYGIRQPLRAPASDASALPPRRRNVGGQR